MTTALLMSKSQTFLSSLLWRTSLTAVNAVSLAMDEVITQFQRLHASRPLIMQTLITVKNVFKYCLKGFSPNGWRPSDNQEVVESVSAVSECAT
ncbi:hypothetical protein GOBAR_AA11754 [Gossypium barbadense]|uniref:Uncharacterized protein n=1 Tax=Gossypium barbadense TaxID=3634 RepID=A0A2P5XZX7_GOSBA|nr:hypothetical protein GOBAR_AA11754 [Gossypium barbadense]